MFKYEDKIAAFKAKLELWERQVNRGIFDMCLSKSLIIFETSPGDALSQLVRNQISMLLRKLSATSQSQKTHELQRSGFVTCL